MALPVGAAELQKASYDVYASGFHAVEGDMQVDTRQRGKYKIDFSAKTRGLLGKLAPWHGIFESKGWRIKKKKETLFRPQEHRSTAVWRGEEEEKIYRYNKNGTFKEYRIKDDENDGAPHPVEKKLTDHSTDILSAALSVMAAVSKGETCTGASEIFDGRRRYKLVFKEKDRVDLKRSRYNVYEGPAIRCTAEVKPAGGAWHKKPRGWLSIQEQGRKRGTMPTIWMAVLKEGEPALPVKVRVKTEYGALFMHMTGYDSGTQKLALKD